MRVLLVWLWTTLVLHTSMAVIRPRRSLGSLLGTTTDSPPIKYPVWKVHKYTGVELTPVRPDEHENIETSEYGVYEPRETAGEPPSLVEVPDFSNQHHSDEKGQGGFLLRLFGIGSPEREAEDKVGAAGALVAPHLIKKKKQVLGLSALANLLSSVNNGKVAGPVDIQQLLGNVWDTVTSPKNVYPVKNTVYRDIPSSYPSAPSLLSKLPIVGTYFAPSGTVIKLPDPALPHIPQLKLVPEAPKLPHLYLSGPYRTPYSTGSYVSVKLPTPPKVQELLPSALPPAPEVNDVPVTSYGIPLETPKSVHSSPADHMYPSSVHPQYTPPAQEYVQPQQYSQPLQDHQHFLPDNQPTQEYGQPQHYTPSAQDYSQQQLYSPPAQEYGQPQHHTPSAQDYGQPQLYSPPAQEYGQPQHHTPSSQEYGQQQHYLPLAQEYSQPQHYSPPAQEYSQPQHYSSPAQEYGLSQDYSAPAQDYQLPAQEYSSPVQQSQTTYNPKQQVLQTAQKKSSQDEISTSEMESLTVPASEWKALNELGQGMAVNEVSRQS